MNRRESEQLINAAYDEIIDDLAGGGRAERLHGYEQAVRRRSKFESCGRGLTSPRGHEVKHWCRRAVCPTCATFWGRKLGRALVAACPDSSSEDFRMGTLVVGFAPTPDDGFDQFRGLRRSLGNALDYRRRTAGIDRSGWRAFGMAGALELDQFQAKDFPRLGTDKRSQFLSLGFEPGRAYGPQWVVTAHALVHVGTLGDDAAKAFLGSVAPVVHLQGLHDDKGLIENAERITGYGAKVKLETTLTGGEVQAWPLDAVKAFLAATMRCSRGRQGFKLAIRPAGTRKNQGTPCPMDYIEPMPVLL